MFGGWADVFHMPNFINTPTLCAIIMMIRLLIIVFGISFILPKLLDGQQLNSELSRIFFRQNINILDTNLTTQFCKNSLLQQIDFQKTSKFDSAKIDSSDYFSTTQFKFSTNNYIQNDLDNGILTLINRTTNKIRYFVSISLQVYFKTKVDVNSFYRVLYKKMKRLSDNKTEYEGYPKETKRVVFTNRVDNKKVELFKVAQATDKTYYLLIDVSKFQ